MFNVYILGDVLAFNEYRIHGDVNTCDHICQHLSGSSLKYYAIISWKYNALEILKKVCM